jgi:hypothetical protein
MGDANRQYNAPGMNYLSVVNLDPKTIRTTFQTRYQLVLKFGQESVFEGETKRRERV